MAKQTIITHDGKFHADDCFAVAALLLLGQDAEVVRTRDPKLIAKAETVLDVGGVYDASRNRFDHHQKEGAGERPNGIPYAAFGLVWKKFGEQIAGGKEAAAILEEKLVQPLDAHDNGVALALPSVSGVSLYEVSDVVCSFVPSWREKEVPMDERFRQAVSFAQKMLLREIERAQAQVEGAKRVEKAVREAEDNRLVVLNEDLPWKEALARIPAPLFVVHPQDGRWFVECVRDNPATFLNRKNLPESWAGLRDEEIAKATGVSDAIFCHRNRFMAVAHSRGGALALAALALAN